MRITVAVSLLLAVVLVLPAPSDAWWFWRRRRSSCTRVNCIAGPWGSWSPCTSSAFGVCYRERRRSLVRQGSCGGTICTPVSRQRCTCPATGGGGGGGFSNNCMRCICEVEGCQSQVGRCRPDGGSDSCGPYQIKNPYWIDCGRPGGDWRNCTKQTACSERCVRSYMERWGRRCTRGRAPTCRDYAMIHNGGPDGCRQNLLVYWGRVQACCNRRGGC